LEELLQDDNWVFSTAATDTFGNVRQLAETEKGQKLGAEKKSLPAQRSQRKTSTVISLTLCFSENSKRKISERCKKKRKNNNTKRRY